MQEKIPPHVLKEAIIMKFGSLKNCAKKMKLSAPYVTRGLVPQKPNYMSNLAKAGLTTEDINAVLLGSNNTIKERINNLETKIKDLEKSLKEKDNIIEHQNILLDQYKLMLDRKKK